MRLPRIFEAPRESTQSQISPNIEKVVVYGKDRLTKPELARLYTLTLAEKYIRENFSKYFEDFQLPYRPKLDMEVVEKIQKGVQLVLVGSGSNGGAMIRDFSGNNKPEDTDLDFGVIYPPVAQQIDRYDMDDLHSVVLSCASFVVNNMRKDYEFPEIKWRSQINYEGRGDGYFIESKDAEAYYTRIKSITDRGIFGARVLERFSEEALFLFGSPESSPELQKSRRTFLDGLRLLAQRNPFAWKMVTLQLILWVKSYPQFKAKYVLPKELMEKPENITWKQRLTNWKLSQALKPSQDNIIALIRGTKS